MNTDVWFTALHCHIITFSSTNNAQDLTIPKRSTSFDFLLRIRIVKLSQNTQLNWVVVRKRTNIGKQMKARKKTFSILYSAGLSIP